MHPDRSTSRRVLLTVLAVAVLAFGWWVVSSTARPAGPAPRAGVRQEVVPDGDGATAFEIDGPDRAAVGEDPGPGDPTEPPPDSAADHLLSFRIRTEAGERIGSGWVNVTHRHDGESAWQQASIESGEASLRVESGAVLQAVDVEPLEIELPQLGWTAGDVRTSGFVYLDVSDVWFGDDTFDRRIEGDRLFEITVSTGVTVQGRVVDASTGRGLGGAWVLVDDHGDSAGARSAPDGSFLVGGRAPLVPDWDEELVVSAIHPSYRATRLVIPLSEAGSPVEGLELRMEPGVCLGGTVVDALGGPVPGAVVRLMLDREVGAAHDLLGASWSTQADDSGRFGFWGATPSDHAELWIRDLRGGRASHLHGPFALRTDLAGLVVAIPSHAMLRLWPILPDGSPVRSGCVAVLSVGGEPRQPLGNPGAAVAVPLGTHVGWTMVHEAGGAVFFAEGGGRFVTATSYDRDVPLQPYDPERHLVRADDPLFDPGEQVSSNTVNVRSHVLAHEYLVEVVEAGPAGAPITDQLVEFSFSFADGARAVLRNATGRMRMTLPAGLQWCRVRAEGFDERCYRLRVPIAGRSRWRVELVRGD